MPMAIKEQQKPKGSQKMLRVTSSVGMEIGEYLSLPSDNNNRNKRMVGKREGRSGRRGQETSPGSSIDPGDSGQGPGDQLSPVGAPSHGQVLAALGLGFSSSQGRVRMCSPFTGPSWKRDLRGCAAGLDPPLWVLPHFCARCVLCTDQDRALGSRRCCPTFPCINSFLPRLPHPCEHTPCAV